MRRPPVKLIIHSPEKSNIVAEIINNIAEECCRKLGLTRVDRTITSKPSTKGTSNQKRTRFSVKPWLSEGVTTVQHAKQLFLAISREIPKDWEVELVDNSSIPTSIHSAHP